MERSAEPMGTNVMEEVYEPEDALPVEYSRTLEKVIMQHAHSEIVGMQPESDWILRAPSLQKKMILVAKVQDEAGHGLLLYYAAATLGITYEAFMGEFLKRQVRHSAAFDHPSLTWADVGAIAWLTDGAASVNQRPLCRTSYGPYARAMQKICLEEAFHVRQGWELLRELAHGTDEQRQMAQDAVDRWWFPALAFIFGPPDTFVVPDPSGGETGSVAFTAATENGIKWRIRFHSNDQLRQKFIDLVVPQAKQLGLSLPDPAIAWDEQAGHYRYTPISLRAYRDLIRKTEQCSQERFERRKKAHEDGAWVRAALRQTQSASTRTIRRGTPVHALEEQ
ncbi:1,2-phenylacetyl-CoA epoxidase subunit PaaA [Mycobacterium sp.]|uniref:1,2-phenylacetyl-CoA epoxidase subunit PaaA n=1 Tax=Mycobacterium sp. TaxID=1785 RepID=UPI003BABC839